MCYSKYSYTTIPNKLNHKLQAHARVREENKEKETNDSLLKYFAVEGLTLECFRRTVTRLMKMELTARIVQNIKVLVV